MSGHRNFKELRDQLAETVGDERLAAGEQAEIQRYAEGAGMKRYEASERAVHAALHAFVTSRDGSIIGPIREAVAAAIETDNLAPDNTQGAVSAMRAAATLLEEVGTNDYVNPPTAEAMQRVAADLRAVAGGQ